MRMMLEEIAACTEAAPSQPLGNLIAEGACIDSRQCQTGNLFVCIKGSNADGHDFAKDAARKGASAILASQPLPDLNIPVLLVKDTVVALGKLARQWRRYFHGKVVCITGTAGKTTLKDALADLLSTKYKTARSDKNHNNQIGLPLSILSTNGSEDFWVVEAGISHAGDMEDLARIAEPDLAIILNVGPGHTEGLGDKGVAWHKTRLFKYLQNNGQALASADYPELIAEINKLGAQTRYFSAHNNPDCQYCVESKDSSQGIFHLRLGNEIFKAQTPFLGDYGAELAIAAASAANLLGMEINDIARGFAAVKLPNQRNSMHKQGNWHIIDDTYNANPLSMQRMLEAASAYARKLRLPFVAVLGEMGELGEDAEKWHHALGILLNALAPEKIFWKGSFSDEVNNGLLENTSISGHEKYSSPQLMVIYSPANFCSQMEILGKDERFSNGGVIIFKGSRLNRLEDYLKMFTASIEKAQREQNVL